MNKTTRMLSVLTLGVWAMGTGLMAAPAGDLDKVPMTLTGCVMAGEAKDSFLLPNVTVDGPVPNNVFYRFDSIKTLRNHVGQRVEVQGYADLNDMDKGTVKIEKKDGKVETQVTSERQTVTVPVEVRIGSMEWISSGQMKADIATYKLDVKSVKRLEGGTCPAAK